MRKGSSPNSNYNAEKERQKRREQWKIQQEKERQHERFKQKKIEEYERKRAEKLGLTSKLKSLRRSRSISRSRSRSKDSHHKSHSTPRTNNTHISFEKIKVLGNKDIFKDAEAALRVDEKELRKIQIKIERDIPEPANKRNEICRQILNLEDITLKRREGEGSKPIFDRQELKNSQEVEEHRTIEVVDKAILDKNSHPKRRSVSLSPGRHRSSRSITRYDSHSHLHRSRSRERSRQYSEDYHRKSHQTERHSSRTNESSHESSRIRSSRARSHSRDRDRDYHSTERDHSRLSRNSNGYRENRERSQDRSYDRRDRRNFSNESHIPPNPYLEQMSFPVYYGPLPPRPMLIGPALQPIRTPMVRGHVPGPLMRAPYPPRFPGPQNMYRGTLPSNYRYGPIY